MLLAMVFAIQAATASPNPCTDQMSALCRISPLFCPSAYPSNVAPGTGNIPCWPERAGISTSRDTRVVQRPAVASGPQSANTKPAAAPSHESGSRGTARSIARVVEPR
jgi:hypothetical protein